MYTHLGAPQVTWTAPAAGGASTPEWGSACFISPLGLEWGAEQVDSGLLLQLSLFAPENVSQWC